jgi:hypothetical protein
MEGGRGGGGGVARRRGGGGRGGVLFREREVESLPGITRVSTEVLF